MTIAALPVEGLTLLRAGPDVPPSVTGRLVAAPVTVSAGTRIDDLWPDADRPAQALHLPPSFRGSAGPDARESALPRRTRSRASPLPAWRGGPKSLVWNAYPTATCRVTNVACRPGTAMISNHPGMDPAAAAPARTGDASVSARNLFGGVVAADLVARTVQIMLNPTREDGVSGFRSVHPDQRGKPIPSSERLMPPDHDPCPFCLMSKDLTPASSVVSDGMTERVLLEAARFRARYRMRGACSVTMLQS